jgi:phosphoribosylformimino-5-aminoimidazole carboxamide ribotide isomerase
VIVPCIDLMGGRAVQLVRGRKRALAVDDVLGLLGRFRGHPWLHVIDLDAALGRGNNTWLVRQLLEAAPMKVRVGGGVRTIARAERLLALGAAQVIVGSRAFRRGAPDHAFLRRLKAAVGRRRVVLALDSYQGRIAVRGWRETLALEPADVMAELAPHAAAFLCTHVDREGTMAGVDLEWFRGLRRATDRPIIAAGGIRSRREVAALARMGMDAAVGMALYTGRMRDR